jgi:hypothetical protein
MADSEAKQSNNQSIKEDRDSKLLLPVADLKAQWKKKDGGEVVSLMRRPPFTYRKIPDTHFC